MGAAHERGLGAAASQQNADADLDTLERGYGEMLGEVRANFNSGKAKSAAWRINQLKQIKRCIAENKDEMCRVMKEDLGRCKYEAIFGEALTVLTELDFMINNVESWVAPERQWHTLLVQPGYSEIRREAKGVVLVLSPWNFPVNLSILCLATAIVGGNACVIKPSEVAPESAKFIEMLVNKYLDTDLVRCVQGAVDETTALLRLRWDHIIYTGNGAVARIVMTAAAKHLTPVTLELGGKSPCVIDPSCSLKTAARRILGSKLLNAGQICIAPDYIITTPGYVEKLVPVLKETLVEFYGEDPSQAEAFGRIINERHHDRIMRLMDPSSHGGEIIAGGPDKADRASKYIPPTIVLNPSTDSPLMTEEIFGPVLPIITIDSIDESIDFIQSREHPLALYVFAENKDVIEKVVANTQSGGVCVNDCIYHITNPYLPFGGVGSSGMGCYHGKYGFDEVTHAKSVMHRSTMIDPSMRYPNKYNGEQAEKILDFLAKEGMSPATKKLIAVAGVSAIGFLLMRRSSRM
ncbi:Aldehyde dehydrogenase [Hondaea fermentalgiana]|uniref:Aldehyde dehydrogenase n=1 Tax=Hondaea fermentalgiana TaxID=2315210 RepID=A0A2R5GKG1_9STRA|nr:Aldehyde dehydrogenase [Hondaea fermentalgiana]|eukprot:GBG28771.1 Aldehyde dehydrogenase [Hondaea fermentalgiana]